VIALRRAVVFNYNSLFSPEIKKTIERYNEAFPEKAFKLDMYDASKIVSESLVGRADVIIHSGGDGVPVEEDTEDIPKFYICHSHQWKARKEGGSVVRLKEIIKGVKEIEVSEDDDILGGRGALPIMQYHKLAVVRPPEGAKVLARSRVTDPNGEVIEIIEAIKYGDRSISVQGHPEEGTAAHLLFNFLNKGI